MLLERGFALADLLRREGRDEYAETVDELVTAVRQEQFVTIEQFAERTVFTPQIIRNLVENGRIEATKINDQYLISGELAAKMDELNAVLADLDEDRPPLTPEEAIEAFAEERKAWTWIGKEA